MLNFSLPYLPGGPPPLAENETGEGSHDVETNGRKRHESFGPPDLGSRLLEDLHAEEDRVSLEQSRSQKMLPLTKKEVFLLQPAGLGSVSCTVLSRILFLEPSFYHTNFLCFPFFFPAKA